MEGFPSIVNGLLSLFIIVQLSILDVCGGPSYTSANSFQTITNASRYVLPEPTYNLKFHHFLSVTLNSTKALYLT